LYDLTNVTDVVRMRWPCLVRPMREILDVRVILKAWGTGCPDMVWILSTQQALRLE
jgi:hypothetical protein